MDIPTRRYQLLGSRPKPGRLKTGEDGCSRTGPDPALQTAGMPYGIPAVAFGPGAEV
ncbi:MAG: hypothetical protein IPN45_14065 [Actinomycetales bacterium]|nr:hypothetical protein [Actinomycetales bacterium]